MANPNWKPFKLSKSEQKIKDAAKKTAPKKDKNETKTADRSGAR